MSRTVVGNEAKGYNQTVYDLTAIVRTIAFPLGGTPLEKSEQSHDIISLTF